jgi:dipeptidyl aminopeptidase/acylaminoacyl peptidase
MSGGAAMIHDGGKAHFEEARGWFERLRAPGSGQIFDATQLHVSPDGRHAVFAGSLASALEGTAPARVCRVDLATGDLRVLTFGPGSDRSPKYSPDGRTIAFLSDRHRAGDVQLYLFDAQTGAARAAPRVEGWVESLHWSPDGERLLLGVAGHGADRAGAQGAVTSASLDTARAAGWMPQVQTGDEAFRWRRLWTYERSTQTVKRIGPQDLNVWEATWCGNAAVAAVASSGPGEGEWYRARLYHLTLDGAPGRELYRPQDQIGGPTASPSGRCLAFVEAVCSDRGLVAGVLKLLDVASGRLRSIATREVDVANLEWRSESRLLIGGHRGFESVILEYDADTAAVEELWHSTALSGTGRFLQPVVAGPGARRCALVTQGYLTAIEIATLEDEGLYRCVRSLDVGASDAVRARIASVEPVTWSAPDGLDIQGWLLRPPRTGPHPLVLHVHGGPVFHWQPRWLGRHSSGISDLMLLDRGYALLYPNPRGSSGRGVPFARRVQGDLGGAETLDHLSGLDHLTRSGIADPTRLGVTGGSHGGFMTSWLITQDTRFAAAVPCFPVTDRILQYLTCAHTHYVSLFLNDRYSNPGGRFFSRSPIRFAARVRTPTLGLAGALDRCTPASQAVAFHNALREHGVTSAVAVYPLEGHGVSSMPAAFDYCSRIVDWFERYMSPCRAS